MWKGVLELLVTSWCAQRPGPAAPAPPPCSSLPQAAGAPALPLQLLLPGPRLTRVSVPQATTRKKLSLLRPRPSLYS